MNSTGKTQETSLDDRKSGENSCQMIPSLSDYLAKMRMNTITQKQKEFNSSYEDMLWKYYHSRAIKWFANLPDNLRTGYSIDTFSEQLQQKCLEFFSENRWCMFLTGGVGSRKTTYAVAVSAVFIRGAMGWPYFVSADDLFKKLQDLSACAEAIETWKQADLLILDDLGTGKITEHVKESVALILQHRYNNNYPTIITTNKNITEFSNIFDRGTARISSRMKKGMLLDFGEKDWR